jgi:hypothetical protein
MFIRKQQYFRELSGARNLGYLAGRKAATEDWAATEHGELVEAKALRAAALEEVRLAKAEAAAALAACDDVLAMVETFGAQLRELALAAGVDSTPAIEQIEAIRERLRND